MIEYNLTLPQIMFPSVEISKTTINILFGSFVVFIGCIMFVHFILRIAEDKQDETLFTDVVATLISISLILIGLELLNFTLNLININIIWSG
jgi:hypothetical protein